MQQLGSRSSLSWRRCSGAATHERATAAAVMRTRSAPVALWRCSPCRRPQLPSARASSPSDSEFEGVPPGDEALQDALESTLRLQVQSETLKEGIRDGLRQKVDEARRIGEEVRAVAFDVCVCCVVVAAVCACVCVCACVAAVGVAAAVCVFSVLVVTLCLPLVLTLAKHPRTHTPLAHLSCKRASTRSLRSSASATTSRAARRWCDTVTRARCRWWCDGMWTWMVERRGSTTQTV